MSYPIRQNQINNMNPPAADAHLGDVVADLIAANNALRTYCAAQQTQFTALLAKLDSANLAGLGSTNSTTFAVAPPQADAVIDLESR